MREWQVGQAMESTRAASSARRAAGTLREGGKAGHGLTGGVEERVTPDEGDQGEVAMETWPGATLVVAESELLLAILMKSFDGPPLMGETELVVELTGIEALGEVPLRLTVLAWERALAPSFLGASCQPRGPVASPWARCTRSRQACRWLPCC